MKLLQNQRGYTLIESIMFIAVITAVAIGIIKVVSSMLDRYKISRLTSQVTELQKSINVRFAASESYKELTSALLKKENLAPGDVSWSGAVMYHKYNNKITVSPSLGNRAYDITFTGVPKRACVELAIQNWAHDQYSNLMHMRVNSVIMKWRDATYIMPISVAQAEKLCTSEKDNTILWRFQ